MNAIKVAKSAYNTLLLPMNLVQAGKQTANNLQSLQAMEGKKPQTLAGVFIMMDSQLSRVNSTIIQKVAVAVDIKPSTIYDLLRQSSG